MTLLNTIMLVVDSATDIFNEGELTGEVMEFQGFTDLLSRFFFNLIFVVGIIHFLYYRKARRADYYFTFAMISISIFLMIYLLGSVKIKVGFALGLFAIFGIIRYRTESMPVREMTYLFVIIAMSVINALAVQVDWLVILATNMLFVLCFVLFEQTRKLEHLACKYVKYDRIDLIKPARRADLIADLRNRLGIEVVRVDVGTVNFLKDMTLLKVYYKPEDGNEENTVDEMTKIPTE